MNINPFDLAGGQFLVFYLVTGILTVLIIKSKMKLEEANWQIPKLNLIDPYEIAFLRGGSKEALRIVVISLIDRGLIIVSDKNLKTKSPAAIDSVRRPIEKAVLKYFSSGLPALDMYKDPHLEIVCLDYQNALKKQQLVATGQVYASRRPLLFIGLAVLVGVAGVKILIALQRGRHNIGFLIALAIAFSVYLFVQYGSERTGLGDRVLEDLKVLFKSLKDRANSIRPGGATNEPALLAAVYGVSALSASSFPYVEKLFPQASKNSQNSNYSCGSSCGTSCSGGGGGGSSCGSGCGGCGGD